VGRDTKEGVYLYQDRHGRQYRSMKGKRFGRLVRN